MLEPYNDNTRHLEELLHMRRLLTRKIAQLRHSSFAYCIPEWEARLKETDAIIDDMVPPINHILKQLSI